MKSMKTDILKLKPRRIALIIIVVAAALYALSKMLPKKGELYT